MATLTPSLTLTSTDVSSDTLSFTVDDTLTVGAPLKSLSRISLVGDATATDILTAANSTTTYVYVKNTDSTNHIKLFTGASELFGIVWPGEFSFFAIIDGEGLKAQANTGNCVLEYGYWTKA
jgi:hypothetical protein|tara:strand:- start:890 stop:1255 length:366 start_codon:yes stop_codon:yes gene_type:complete